MSHSRLFVLSPGVSAALNQGRPVVALESHLIAHALPWPDNVTVGRQLAELVRDRGVEPAFVAILDGRVRVGLETDQIEELGATERVAKVSQRDLGAILASGAAGASTVSVTMHAARHFGIRVMATGGIGGVHRGYADSHDVSADLTALASIPVAVTCSGAKSILDIGRTLEALETLGVPVYGYGTDDFPAYETPSSGHRVPLRLDDVGSIAAALDCHWRSGLTTGVVVANPVPEEFATSPEEIEAAITAGMEAAELKGVAGSAITPFLLEEMARATGGESRRAVVGLTTANALLGAGIAAALAHLG